MVFLCLTLSTGQYIGIFNPGRQVWIICFYKKHSVNYERNYLKYICILLFCCDYLIKTSLSEMSQNNDMEKLLFCYR